MVPEVAEGGAEALALVQGVFVDAQVLRAIQGDPLTGLAPGELGVDARHGRLAQALGRGNGAGTDPVVVLLEHLFPESLGAVPALQHAGQDGNEAA